MYHSVVLGLIPSVSENFLEEKIIHVAEVQLRSINCTGNRRVDSGLKISSSGKWQASATKESNSYRLDNRSCSLRLSGFGHRPLGFGHRALGFGHHALGLEVYRGKTMLLMLKVDHRLLKNKMINYYLVSKFSWQTQRSIGAQRARLGLFG